MNLPIALQLYSVRDLAARDYASVLRQVADMGYDGVEPAGFPGTTAQAAGRLFRELGLRVPSAHIFPPPSGERLAGALEMLEALDCRRVVSGLGLDDFATLDATYRSCDELNRAFDELSRHGVTLAVHNHWWEYLPVEGRYPYQVMAERLHPAIQFEVDSYWVRVAGQDPVAVLSELGPRAALLHLKDGPATREGAMLPLGEGVVDVRGIVAAAQAEWLIVELDRCDSDMLEAVRRSVAYLRGGQHGR